MTADDPDESPQATQVTEAYTRYSEGLLAYVRAELPIAKNEAADVVHKVFEEFIAWTHKNPGRILEYPQAFVYKLASRHLRKHAARCRRTTSCPDTAVPAETVEISSTAREDDVAYMAGLSMASRNLLRAMRRLSDPSGTAPIVPELQRIVYLRFWEGMTEAEVGEVLEIPRGTVASRWVKAKGELLVRLQELEAQEPGSTQTSTTLLNRWWARLQSADK